MNNLYFACCNCKIYIDAGYRWAYWELEKAGIVTRGEGVNVEAVLAAENYWNPPEEELSRWLYEEVFPPLRQFLQDHKNHRLVFGEDDDFAPTDDYYLDWMQIGFCMKPTPRYFMEVLGFESWAQVCEYMRGYKYPTVWSEEEGRQKFEELVRKKDSYRP